MAVIGIDIGGSKCAVIRVPDLPGAGTSFDYDRVEFPTTGLDEENQKIVLDSLTRLAAGRTTFMITHDLKHVARADLVLVLENGRIVESGAPAELRLDRGRFTGMMARRSP